MSKHTPGPWSQGRVLRTRQTQQWTPEQWARGQAIEGRAVFARFTAADEGRSRILVAQCDREEDARLIVAAPDLLEALKLAKSIMGHPDDDASKFIAAAIVKATGEQE